MACPCVYSTVWFYLDRSVELHPRTSTRAGTARHRTSSHMQQTGRSVFQCISSVLWTVFIPSEQSGHLQLLRMLLCFIGDVCIARYAAHVVVVVIPERVFGLRVSSLKPNLYGHIGYIHVHASRGARGIRLYCFSSFDWNVRWDSELIWTSWTSSAMGFAHHHVVLSLRIHGTTAPWTNRTFSRCRHGKLMVFCCCQARVAIRNMFLGDKVKQSDLLIPWCTYTEPEVAHAGKYEAELSSSGVEFESYVVSNKTTKRGGKKNSRPFSSASDYFLSRMKAGLDKKIWIHANFFSVLSVLDGLSEQHQLLSS